MAGALCAGTPPTENRMTAKATESVEVSVPVLPLRDVVVYPSMVIPLFVGREKSIRALDAAMEGDRHVLLLAQKSPDTDDPGADDLFHVGTLATVLQLLKLPDGTIKVLVEGGSRVRVTWLADGGTWGYSLRRADRVRFATR